MMSLAILCAQGWEIEDAMQTITARRPVVDFADVYVESVEKFLQQQVKAADSCIPVFPVLDSNHGGSMSHAGRRKWRLFTFALLCGFGVGSIHAQTVTLTTVSDVVYRADGNPASGTLLISWPAFVTADGHAVAAGNKSVILGAGGTFSAQLAPNSGATPGGVVYAVVYQLSDATVKTENWSVGTSSPETVAQVCAFLGTSTASGQLATQQFVNSALANVVHLSGAETIDRSQTVYGGAVRYRRPHSLDRQSPRPTSMRQLQTSEAAISSAKPVTP